FDARPVTLLNWSFCLTVPSPVCNPGARCYSRDKSKLKGCRMTSTWQINPAGKGRFLPDDLSLYIGKKTLGKLVLEAMEEANARKAEREGRESRSVAFESAMMLTLLTYCYATGVYGSMDIQLGMQRDRKSVV